MLPQALNRGRAEDLESMMTVSHLTSGEDELFTNMLAALPDYTFSPLTQSRAEYFATVLNGLTGSSHSHLRTNEKRLVALIATELSGGSVSELTSGEEVLLADIVNNPPSESVPAVSWDFNVNSLSRGAALTGATGTYGTLLASIWAKSTLTVEVGDSGENGFFDLSIDVSGNDATFSANLYDSGFNGDTVEGMAAGAGTDGEWHHYLLSYDASDENKCKVIIDGANVTNNVSFFNVANPTLAGETNFIVLPDSACDVAEYYVAFGQWLDLTNPVNVAKFIGDGKPVNLGADGSLPTGVAPTILFSGDASSFATNKGTGGAFNLTGSLTNAATSPSD